MSYPRSVYVPQDTPGVYHCMSRCVRRAFLCGEDPLTGRSFDHRRDWIENRILQLAEIFAVSIYGYAVMSNHYHLIIETDPTAPRAWSDEEVANRWLYLSGTKDDQRQMRLEALMAQPERLEVLRERLGSLSWFMRHLNEPIARRSNREDDCTGRFWEGRFRCQVLLDETAVLSAMVYVDLNPIRAGEASTPEESSHTSVARRARASASTSQHQPLEPVSASIESHLPLVTVEHYLQLVDWTGRSLHPEKKGVIPAHAPPILKRLALEPKQWLIQVPATESQYWRAIGRLDALLEFAQRLGRRWLCGVGIARAMEAHTRS